MQNYINQLLQDLKKAEDNPIPEPDFSGTYEEFEKQMLKIETETYQPSESILGITYEELPPADKMTTEQIHLILDAMLKALLAKGTKVAFPSDDIPVAFAYTQLKEQFKEGFHAMPGWTIDFCGGNCSICEFKDYCDVKDESWHIETVDEF